MMERFTITRVSNKDVNKDAAKDANKDAVHRNLDKIRHEIAINVGDLNNMRRNSRTVPNLGEARKFSLAQLTRWRLLINFPRSIKHAVDDEADVWKSITSAALRSRVDNFLISCNARQNVNSCENSMEINARSFSISVHLLEYFAEKYIDTCWKKTRWVSELEENWRCLKLNEYLDQTI